ncbi:hypothetical protein ACHMW6_15690 [Pseudoduganella sp. UC29_106]|uniref:hypothetical protein n=1 Tax=Pseudoduganella sp. UC29_106 TaxID=3374553 RepID=UPI0037564CC5
MSSDEPIKAGRPTTAESTTYVLAAIPSERDVDFNGKAIVVVGPQPDTLKPTVKLDGVHGVGNVDGSGVVGFGADDEGTGVVGLGGGFNGDGGLGVHAIGGRAGRGKQAGAGVLAQGGRMTANDGRIPHGPGVIAMGGGHKMPLPPSEQTGSVGVFAVGAEAEATSVSDRGVHVDRGPLFPGAGVVGRGGLALPLWDGRPGAAGVIGLAGESRFPPIGETGNTGVYGRGPIGVQGFGESDRAGIFNARFHAQVRLVPKIATTINVLDAKIGDLLAVSEVTRDGRSSRAFGSARRVVRRIRRYG